MCRPLIFRVTAVFLVVALALAGTGPAAGVVDDGDTRMSDVKMGHAETADPPEMSGAAPTGPTTVATAQSNNSIEQSGGGIVIVLSKSAQNYTLGKPVNVSIGERSPTTVSGTVSKSENESTYKLPPQRLPVADLNPVDVVVEQDGKVKAKSMELNKITLSTASVEGGQVRLQTETLVGPEEVTLNAASNNRGPQPVSATRDGDTLVVPRSELTQFYLPPTTVTLDSTDGYLEGNSQVRIGELVLDGAATDEGIEIYGDQLVPNESYGVAVETTLGRYEAIVTASDTERGATLALDNPVLGAAFEATITIRHDGGVIDKQTVRIHSVRSGTVQDGQVVLDSPLETTVRSVRLIGNRSIRVNSENVSTTVVVNRTDVEAEGYNLSQSPYSIPSNVSRVSREELLGENTSISAETLTSIPKRQVIAFENHTVSEGRHQLLVTTNSTTVPVTVDGNSPGEITVPVADNADTSGTAGSLENRLPEDTWVVILILTLLLAGVGVGVGGAVFGRSTGGGSDSSYEVRVTAVDDTGQKVTAPVVVKSRRQTREPGQPSLPDRLPMGDGTIPLDERLWELYAKLEETKLPKHRRRTEGVDPRTRDQLELTVPPYKATIRFVDGTGDPVEGVEVTVPATQSDKTSVDGICEREIPASTSPVELRADHEAYESHSQTYNTLTALPDEITLTRKTGSIRAIAVIDGDPTAGVPITAGGTQLRTDSTGAVRFEDVPVGSHDVVASLDRPDFGTGTATVDVGEDTSTELRLDVPFELTLSSSQRERLQRLATADRLEPPRRIDGAINGYYASVFGSLASSIEALTTSGSWFAESGLDAESLVAALLETGEEVLQATDAGLSTKHNVDLFSACSQMATARPEWTAGYTVEELFTLAEQGRGQRDRRLGERVRAMDSTLQSQRGELTVISPARDPFDEIRDFYRTYPDQQPEQQLAVTFVLVGYLNAMEAMLDDRSVRTRLNTSIY